MTLAESQPNAALRLRLGQITEITGVNVGEQIPAVVDLYNDFHHSIELITPAIPDNPQPSKYTCFQYAFGLVNPPRLIVDIATIWQEVYPSSQFVRYLIENLLHEIAVQEVVNGDVVVYFAAGKPVHAGIVSGDRVISKWGTAHLWRHGLFEVPDTYGDTVRFFRSLEVGQYQEAFLRFAERETGERFLDA